MRVVAPVHSGHLGPGIPDDVVSKIFEPFYSSKTSGEGTGLGLSISRDIVTRHWGRLTVDTRDGEYTSLIVDLPAIEEEIANGDSAPPERNDT